MADGVNVRNDLGVLHERLDRHYQSLSVQRAESVGAPVFALEHGLSDPELSLLKQVVRASVAGRYLPPRSYLPFVVYAAEVGYVYAGDSFWPAFESLTPGWVVHGNRPYIRRKFQEFAERFNGARPVGAWADHFSIIAWPITHAVLPTDLQVQLAKLLFDYRRVLTAEQLLNPEDLGRRLASRSWHCSNRFQQFAENTDLLGQVAAALLGEEDTESPYLLRSTFDRIVEGLEKERDARRWLREARASADRVRRRGFRPREVSRSGGQSRSGERSPAATDPEVFWRLDEGEWTCYLKLADMAPLAVRFPGIRTDISRLRPVVAGHRQLARGRLAFSDQIVRLERWPQAQEPVVRLEGASATLNALLADQCVLSPGPVWLFRVRDDGRATEVRGKFVRPGHCYLIASRQPIEALPDLVRSVSSRTEGVFLAAIDVPSALDDDDCRRLKGIGVGTLADMRVRPCGVVPAEWDGEGSLEWVTGDDPVVGISSDRVVDRCIVNVDGVSQMVKWPDDGTELYLAFRGLEVGRHAVEVALLPDHVDDPVATGSLLIAVRAPQAPSPLGTYREGLTLTPAPAAPTLEELWSGNAAVQIHGPREARVGLDLIFRDRLGARLAEQRLTCLSPVDNEEWRRVVLAQLRGHPSMQTNYDRAERLDLVATHPALGRVALHFERAFAALRWVSRDDRDGPFAQLVNNSDSPDVPVVHAEFERPAQFMAVAPDQDGKFRSVAGGLLWAAGDATTAGVILPPFVRTFEDLRRCNIVPTLPPAERTVSDILRLIDLAGRWGRVDLPGNPVALNERSAVLVAIQRQLLQLTAGPRWVRSEPSAVEGNHDLERTLAAMFDEGYHRVIAEAIRAKVPEWLERSPADRVHELSSILSAHAGRAGFTPGDVQLSEILLRFASAPDTLAGWSTEQISVAAELMIVSPVLVRAARLAVLGVAMRAPDADLSAGGRSWSWS